MNLWHTPTWIAGSVRNKLLAMALAPLLVVFPLLVLALLVWSHVAYDRLLITKVRSDLAVAKGYFEQVMNEVGSGTQGVAASYALRRALEPGITSVLPQTPSAYAAAALNTPAVTTLLEQEKNRLGLDFLVLTPTIALSAADRLKPTGLDTVPAAISPRTASGPAGTARLVVLHAEALRTFAPHLLERIHIPLLPTRNSAPSQRTEEDRAMVMLASLPVQDDQGRHFANLHGGLLLNQNLDFIDHINRIVYPDGSLPFKSQGTATLFLDDVRITTNVRLFQHQRAIGTRVSQTVRDTVLAQGQTWLDRAFVVDDWYVSAYQPLQDAQGERVGMLYVGYLEQPFRWVRYGMLAIMGLIFLGVMALAAWFSVRWARSIFKPVEQMNQTMQRVESGEALARVGAVAAKDEIGALASHLDQLLDMVDDNTRRLREWGETLDRRVADRTRELETANASLQQTQLQLVKSEKLAAIGQLTASIAHEINNPIAVIQGNLDLIRDTLGSQAIPVQSELKLLDEQVERMRLIVTQLLQYARPTEFAGYVDALDVNQTLDDCLVLVSHLLQERRITVVFNGNASTPVGFNRQELQQVVINLMINAIQAMPEGGELQLLTRDWRDDPEHCAMGAMIEIKDSGPGLQPKVMERLFTPFFTTKNDGNGLGLWISLGLIERYGGKLEAANRDDRQGAVFTVKLLTEPRVPPASQEGSNDGRPGRILGSA